MQNSGSTLHLLISFSRFLVFILVADEFGFDDDERDVKLGGLIALGFFFVGAPVSFVVGWLADSINRSPLYSATVFVGEIGCLMTAFVKTYPALYACRVLTGISIGGAIPVIYSVLGDLYPANQRAGIAAVVTTGTGLGMGIGQVIAGSLDDWRLPFIIVSIPGLICSMLLLFVQDPRRGEKEQAFLEKRNQLINADSTLTDGEDIVVPVVRGNHFESLENCGMDCPTSNSTSCRDTVQRISRIQNDAPEFNNTRDAPRRSIKSSHCVTCQSTKEILKIPSVLLTILQAAPGALPFGFCATFLNDFLQEQRGMTKQVSVFTTMQRKLQDMPRCGLIVQPRKKSNFSKQLECCLHLEQEMRSELFWEVCWDIFRTNEMFEALHSLWEYP